MKRRAALLWLLAAALSAFTILRGISPHDEGLMLQQGARIASGQLPYRDFWSNYPPGQGLVLAALRDLFGAPLLSWRILRVAIGATVSVEAYVLVRRGAPEWLALLAWAAVAGAMAFPMEAGPNVPALALALGGLLLARSHPRAAGVLAGLAILFRFEIGIAGLIGAAFAAERERRVALVAVACAVAAVALLPFFAAAPGAMVGDTVGYLSYQHLQRLPFPLAYDGPVRPSKLIEFYFPAILVVAAALWAAARTRAGIELLPLALVGLLYLLGRTDEFHLLPLSAVLAMMLALAAARERSRAWRWTLVAALVLIAAHGLERRAGQALHPPALAAVPGGGGVRTSPADAAALRGLRAWFAANAPRRTAIFVADPRNDAVRVGDPLLYTILGRPNATPYDVMQPGLVTTARVQREIVRDLAHVPFVVRWLDPTAIDGHASGVRLLDDHLAQAYRETARFGNYAVLTRTISP